MDSHSLRVLEFDKVIEKVASFAVSELGKETTREIEPSPLPKVVQNLQGETAEAKNLLALTNRFPLDGIHDLRPVLERAGPDGAMLDGIDLFRVAETLQAAATLQEFILAQEGRCPHLERLARLIVKQDGLVHSITAAIDPEGRVVDDATPELRSIRGNIGRAESKIRGLLSRLMERADVHACLQDGYVTMRDGRYVLPVLVHRKNEIAGIVHDRSDSGQTVFIEPRGVVELGNELRDLAAQERVEVRRILRELTAQVRDARDAIAGNLQALAAADSICARARFSLRYKLHEPQIADDRELHVMGAQHPLLLFAETEAVPIDLRLDRECRVLVVSGPNAGGKTVALKTVGIVTLMAQAGLHVPASERSQLPVFEDVLADVGDEQSIEEALSSFSGHVARLRDILAQATENTLVLLDELGTATDPQEGGALACAVLDEVYDRGALAVVTTHLHEPKVLAHEYPAMANAAVQFDAETLRPTYQLRIGLPGSSHAFDIATRMSLPQPIIDKARARLGEGAADLEGLLATIRERNQELEKELAEARSARGQAEELEQQYEQAMAQVKKRSREALKKANLEAERVLADAQREAENIISEVRQEAKTRGGKEVRSEVVAKVRKQSRGSREKHRREAERLNADLPPRLNADDISPGMEVFVLSLSRQGRVVSAKPKKGRATVAVAGAQFDVKIEDLTPASDDKPRRTDEPGRRAVQHLRPATPVDPRLNIIGKRVEEAKAEVDRYVEQAALCDHLEVCIVHGFGTGALREAVREVLASHPMVESFRQGEKAEGGGGVTIARLAGGVE